MLKFLRTVQYYYKGALMEAILLALGVSLLLIYLFWPSKKSLPMDDYLALLSPHQWREEAEIYESIIKTHPDLSLTDHNEILFLLHSKNKVEKLVVQPYQEEEAQSPKKFESCVAGVKPFAVIISIHYKLVKSSGGDTGKRNPLPFLSSLIPA